MNSFHRRHSRDLLQPSLGFDSRAVSAGQEADPLTGAALGGVMSLFERPSRVTHASVRGTELKVPVDLARISGGIPSADDLPQGLDQAFNV